MPRSILFLTISLFITYFQLSAQVSTQKTFDAEVQNRIMTTDWGGLLKYQVANKEQSLGQNDRPVAVFMGDSITEGWVYHFPEFFESNNYLNRGIGGQTTAQMLLRFRRDVIKLKPRAVLILAGINDIARNTRFYNLEVVAENIFSMIEIAKSNKIIPIICSVLPADRFAWNPEITPTKAVVQLNTLLKTYAEENAIEYVDYYKFMHNNQGGLQTDLTNDGVHLTKKGYSVMGKIVQSSIEDILQ